MARAPKVKKGRTMAADDIPEKALDWHREGRAVALATVIETWGSAPRGVGSQLVIDGDGAMEGSVSGGCVEGAVVLEALDALASGTARLLTYGVSDDDAFAVGLACGGTIRVLVEPLGSVFPVDILETLVGMRSRSEAVALEVALGGAKGGSGDADATPMIEPTTRHNLVPRGQGHEDRFLSDRSGMDGDTFVAIHNPPLRLIVVGAVHIAQALLPMARIAGFAVSVIDPRPAFGAAARFPDTDPIDEWPDAAMAALAPDARTAVVTLTHDPKLDDPALLAALATDAFYIGCLGSSRTHAKRLQRLTDAGMDETQLARLHAPVGLDIGARNPAEIAVSILSEMIARLRGK